LTTMFIDLLNDVDNLQPLLQVIVKFFVKSLSLKNF
ncbi:MAG: hypothetical protein ACI8Y3_001483, partial [Paraglaciecola sp.]